MFNAPSPLRDALDLENNLPSLDDAFESALNNYSSNIAEQAGDQGFFYKLSFGEYMSLKNKQKDPTTGLGKYGVVIRLTPKSISGTSATTLMAGKANIRLNSLRLWVLGIGVNSDEADRKPVQVNSTMMGQETIVNWYRKEFSYSHDSIGLTFMYDSAGVDTIIDCTLANTIGRQDIQNAYMGGGDVREETKAPFGPWSEWRFELRESENGPIDMTDVHEAYIEVGGMSQGYKT